MPFISRDPLILAGCVAFTGEHDRMRVSRPEWHHSASCKPGSSGLTDRELRLDAAEFRDFRHGAPLGQGISSTIRNRKFTY